jgi:hypothetical protein
MGVADIVGPGFWEWDQAISRQFRITESQHLEVRGEAFNVTNSERFGNPGVVYSSTSTFGKITSSATGGGSLSGAERILQFALKYVF